MPLSYSWVLVAYGLAFIGTERVGKRRKAMPRTANESVDIVALVICSALIVATNILIKIARFLLKP